MKINQIKRIVEDARLSTEVLEVFEETVAAETEHCIALAEGAVRVWESEPQIRALICDATELDESRARNLLALAIGCSGLGRYKVGRLDETKCAALFLVEAVMFRGLTALDKELADTLEPVWEAVTTKWIPAAYEFKYHFKDPGPAVTAMNALLERYPLGLPSDHQFPFRGLQKISGVVRRIAGLPPE